MLGVGIWLVINDTLSLGAVIAANILGRIAYALVQNAMVRWRDVVKASRAYARVRNSLEDEQAPVLSRASSTEPVPLTFKRVSYRYPGQPRSLLQRIELKIKPGELLCVIGSSARGKSTFCRLASGVVTPGAGSVRLGDVDVHRLQKNSLRREIGFLPQDITMFQGTIRQNIASMDDGDIDQIVDVAKLVGIHDAIINLPQGYDTVIEDREPLLSAGQRKCIALARAFYGSPALVILDEPFPHLDYHTRKALVRGINSQLEQGVIVILTSQRKSAARMADQAILLSERKYTLLASKAEINRYFEEREAGRSKRKARGQGKRSSRQKSEAEETDLNDAVIRPRFGHD
jgi:ABC-type protease/lipase transport system fused ATPase/permease subunit